MSTWALGNCYFSQFSNCRLTDEEKKTVSCSPRHIKIFTLIWIMSWERERGAWGGRDTINSVGCRFTRGYICHLSLCRVVQRPFIMKRSWDQSVLSSLTKTPHASSWDNCSGHLPNPAINFDDWRKAWNKDLVPWGSKSRELLCSPSYLAPYKEWIYTRCFFKRTKHSGDSFKDADLSSNNRMINNGCFFYLLSRNLRPSQLLGGDLCRTEFMVHLFGTIYACSPSWEPPPHRRITSSSQVCLVCRGGRLNANHPAMFN